MAHRLHRIYAHPWTCTRIRDEDAHGEHRECRSEEDRPFDGLYLIEQGSCQRACTEPTGDSEEDSDDGHGAVLAQDQFPQVSRRRTKRDTNSHLARSFADRIEDRAV